MNDPEHEYEIVIQCADDAPRVTLSFEGPPEPVGGAQPRGTVEEGSLIDFEIFDFSTTNPPYRGATIDVDADGKITARGSYSLQNNPRATITQVWGFQEAVHWRTYTAEQIREKGSLVELSSASTNYVIEIGGCHSDPTNPAFNRLHFAFLFSNNKLKKKCVRFLGRSAS